MPNLSHDYHESRFPAFKRAVAEATKIIRPNASCAQSCKDALYQTMAALNEQNTSSKSRRWTAQARNSAYRINAALRKIKIETEKLKKNRSTSHGLFWDEYSIKNDAVDDLVNNIENNLEYILEKSGYLAGLSEGADRSADHKRRAAAAAFQLLTDFSTEPKSGRRGTPFVRLAGILAGNDTGLDHHCTSFLRARAEADTARD